MISENHTLQNACSFKIIDIVFVGRKVKKETSNFVMPPGARVGARRTRREDTKNTKEISTKKTFDLIGDNISLLNFPEVFLVSFASFFVLLLCAPPGSK